MVDLRTCSNLSMVRDIAMGELAANNIWVFGEGCERRWDDFHIVRDAGVVIAAT